MGKMTSSIFFWTMLLLLTFSVFNGQAATILVPSDSPTIQQAINSAVNGDTVFVSPGTYTENINFNGKAITVTSVVGSAVTIIDGNNAASVVSFITGEGVNSIINGFTIRNGLSSFQGGGNRIQNSSPTITDNIVNQNKACWGAGISVSGGSPVIQRNSITSNIQSGCSGGIGGGGISVQGNSSAQILNNIISDNLMSSANGGGISLFAAGTPMIMGNTIRGNTATGLGPCAQGGGISLVNASNALIIQNLISGNQAGCGGGIYWLVPSGQSGPLLVNNTIADNDSPLGSGVYADGFDIQTKLVNNIILSSPGQTAVYCGNFNDLNPPIFSFNDIFSPSGAAYGGICTDQTGLNGNISADPLFLDQSSSDFHLTSASPAIDAGDNSASNLPLTDFDGNARILDGDHSGVAVVDMGPYEVCSGDPIINSRSGHTYITIQDAYEDLSNTLDGDTIKIVAVNLSGGLTLDRDISITLEGGNNCSFLATGSHSLLQGTVNINDGVVIVNGIIIH